MDLPVSVGFDVGCAKWNRRWWLIVVILTSSEVRMGDIGVRRLGRKSKETLATYNRVRS